MSLVLDVPAAFAGRRRRFRRPPVLRAWPSHGANASRKPSAFFAERSISYSAPSRAKVTVSSAVPPSIIVFENDLYSLCHALPSFRGIDAT